MWRRPEAASKSSSPSSAARSASATPSGSRPSMANSRRPGSPRRGLASDSSMEAARSTAFLPPPPTLAMAVRRSRHSVSSRPALRASSSRRASSSMASGRPSRAASSSPRAESPAAPGAQCRNRSRPSAGSSGRSSGQGRHAQPPGRSSPRIEASTRVLRCAAISASAACVPVGSPSQGVSRLSSTTSEWPRPSSSSARAGRSGDGGSAMLSASASSSPAPVPVPSSGTNHRRAPNPVATPAA